MSRSVDELPPRERLQAIADARVWSAHSYGLEAVVLIEPDAGEAARIGAALARRGVRFLSFTSPWRALAHIGAEPAAVVVASAGLGAEPLSEIVRAIKDETSAPVLIAHGSGDTDVIGPAVVAGGRPLIRLPYDPQEVIRVACQALPSLPPPARVEFGRLSLVPEWRDAHLDETGFDLSPLEFRILAELVRRGGRCASREALVSAAWAVAPTDPKGVLGAAIRRLRDKFVALGVPDAVETVRGVGYRLNAKTLAESGPSVVGDPSAARRNSKLVQ